VNGYLGIGKTLPGTKLDIAGGNWNVSGGEGDFRIGDGTYRFKIGVANSGGGAGDVRMTAHGGTNRLILGGGGVDVLLVTSNDVLPWTTNVSSLGSSTNKWTAVYATNGTIQTSDARLKTNINDLNYGLPSILMLKPVSFTWKDGSDEATHIGLIAQDVEKVISEVVDKGNDPSQTLGINYSELIPVLIKGIQQQQQQIESQNMKIDKLSHQIKELESRISSTSR
jgi:cell division protein FtsB